MQGLTVIQIPDRVENRSRDPIRIQTIDGSGSASGRLLLPEPDLAPDPYPSNR